MSEVITLKQYDGQSVTPKDDAIVYDLIIGQSGIISGCDLTDLGAGQVKISAGRGIMKGRQFEVQEHTINATLADADTLPGRIYIHMDLSNSATPIKIMHETAAVLSELVQEEDCNETAGVYEIELGTYTATVLTISDLVKTATVIEGAGGAEEIKKELAELSTRATVRYNAETDYFEVLKDGEWKSTLLLAGLLEKCFYSKTAPYDVTWSREPNIGFTLAKGGTSNTVKAYTNDPVNVSAFTKLTISNISFVVTGYYGYSGSMTIYGGSTPQGTDLFTKTVTSDNSYSGSVEIDISNINTDLYITVSCYGKNGSSDYTATVSSSIESIIAHN